MLKWYGPRSKKLVIQGDNPGNYLKLKLESLINHSLSKAETLHEAAGSTSYSSESDVCVNNSFVTQIASLKTDITGSESRFNSELVSEISLLRSKQKDVIAVIRKQDQQSVSLTMKIRSSR